MPMKVISIVFVLVVTVTPLMASAGLTIFDVRRTLPMSDAEPVFRDFYINGGAEEGLSVGMVITVQRRLPCTTPIKITRPGT
ncbi:MAG: hypothetical protein HC902_12470 [Calothrix sp. SM1_5_4]|nr:hypothetical protein [Calothrix sp. SM1_5_4]